jgi:hypothetical protein
MVIKPESLPEHIISYCYNPEKKQIEYSCSTLKIIPPNFKLKPENYNKIM